MNDQQKKEAYEALVNIEKQVSDLHNTLDYWIQKLLSNIDWDIEEHGCQHESDGFSYFSYPPQNKCIKCGEFYR